MPELPRVETTRRGTALCLEGQRVGHVIVRERRLRWPIPKDLDVRLSGQRIVSVERRTKYLLLGAEAGTPISHLGMSGSLGLAESDTPTNRHEHVDIKLAPGMAPRYTDSRHSGVILWNLAPLEHELLRSLSPESLTDAFAGQRPFELSRGRSIAAKPLIMDSAVVTEVGSIYVNEVLLTAGIDPRKPVGNTSKARYLRLAEEIKRVLAITIECGGTTLRDFADDGGQPGYSQQELFVYGRSGELCKVRGSTLYEIRLGQRTSVYCPRCQR